MKEGIIITIRNGVVEAVCAQEQTLVGTPVTVLDYDTDGALSLDLVSVPTSLGDLRAYQREDEVIKCDIDMDSIIPVEIDCTELKHRELAEIELKSYCPDCGIELEEI